MKRLVIFLLLLPAGLSLFSEADFTRWLKTETEHFVFIYEEADLYAVTDLLSYCEEVYNNITGFLGHSPEKVTCVIHGRVDFMNGSFNPLPAHINLYLTAPIGPGLGSKTENPLKMLLIHELTHFIHLTDNKGFLAWFSNIFGPGLKAPTQAFLPYWIIEGITTNTETIFTNGGRGREPFFEIIYKAMAIEDNFFSYNQAGYRSYFPPLTRSYVAGYIIVDFLFNNYGESVFKEIHKHYLDFPFTGPSKAIEKITGKSIYLIFEEMKLFLMQKYRNDKNIPNGELLTPDIPGDYYFPNITKRGWILYRTNMDNYPSIVLYNPVTKEEQSLIRTTLNDYSSLTASKDGDIIVFASIKGNGIHPSGQVYTSDLFLYDFEKNETKKLTDNRHLWNPELSQDGSILIAVQRHKTGSRLVSVDIETGEITLLFSVKGTRVLNPALSPDNSKIIFTLNNKGDQNIGIIDYPIKTLSRSSILWPDDFNSDVKIILIGSESSSEYYPDFIDNNTIIYSSDKNDRLELFLTEINSKKSYRICSDPVAAWSGVIKGEDIIYGSYSTSGFNLKRKTLKMEDANIPVSINQPVEINISEITTLPENNTYYDIAYPFVWFPFPFYLNPFQSSEIIFGAGVQIMGKSVLGLNSWEAAISFPFTDFQPAVSLALTSNIRLINFNYNILQGYHQYSTGLFVQNTQQNFHLTIPLVSLFSLGTGVNLFIYSGIQHNFRIFKEEQFPFFSSFNFEDTTIYNFLSSYSGLTFSIRSPGGVRDLYTPFYFTDSLRVEVLLPLLDRSDIGILINNSTSFSFPSFIPHHVIKVGLKGEYFSSHLLYSSEGEPNYQHRITPRGLFDPEWKTEEILLLGSIDYLFTIAILDIPLFSGFNLLAIGGGAHIEAKMEISSDGTSFIPDEYIYMGLELGIIYGYNAASIPFTFGVSIRFNPLFNRAFDWTKDIRPYLSLSLNSLEDSGLFYAD